MGTFWDAFGWFLEVVGPIWGDEKIVPENGWPKVTQEIRQLPGGLEMTPVFPIRFT